MSNEVVRHLGDSETRHLPFDVQARINGIKLALRQMYEDGMQSEAEHDRYEDLTNRLRELKNAHVLEEKE
jgi:hypothetical protein